MAFKHGDHGGVPGAHRGTLWHCPTCGAENGGPLEAGCQSCKAGADARPVAAVPPVAAGVLPRDLAEGFREWIQGFDPLTRIEANELLRLAFQAGAAWKEQQMRSKVGRVIPGSDLPVPASLPEGGARLSLTIPDTGSLEDVEGPTLATILAALQFYTDNALSYGDIPGQLSATDARALIARLTPKEGSPV